MMLLFGITLTATCSQLGANFLIDVLFTPEDALINQAITSIFSDHMMSVTFVKGTFWIGSCISSENC